MNLQLDQIVNLALAAFSAIATLFAFLATKAAVASLEVQQRSVDMSVLNQEIFSGYTERTFRSADPPVIRGKGKPESRLKLAKFAALEDYMKDPKKWREESHVNKFKEQTWQNATAYETALALEVLGIAVFTGLIPLRLLLPEIGDVVIDDFIISLSWIRSYRETEKVYSKEGIPYPRRHAEWLAAVAGLWMDEYWPNYRRLSALMEEYAEIEQEAELGDDNYIIKGRERLKELVIRFSKADGKLMPKSVRADLKDLIGVRV